MIACAVCLWRSMKALSPWSGGWGRLNNRSTASWIRGACQDLLLVLWHRLRRLLLGSEGAGLLSDDQQIQDGRKNATQSKAFHAKKAKRIRIIRGCFFAGRLLRWGFSTHSMEATLTEHYQEMRRFLSWIMRVLYGSVLWRVSACLQADLIQSLCLHNIPQHNTWTQTFPCFPFSAPDPQLLLRTGQTWVRSASAICFYLRQRSSVGIIGFRLDDSQGSM